MGLSARHGPVIVFSSPSAWMTVAFGQRARCLAQPRHQRVTSTQALGPHGRQGRVWRACGRSRRVGALCGPAPRSQLGDQNDARPDARSGAQATWPQRRVIPTKGAVSRSLGTAGVYCDRRGASPGRRRGPVRCSCWSRWLTPETRRCDKDPKITWTNLAGLGERCVRAARARTSPWRWHRPRSRSETGQGPPTEDLSWSLPKAIIDALSPTRAPRAAGAPVSKRMATSPIMTDRSRQDASHREGSRGLAGSSRHLRDAGPPIRRWAKPDGAMAGVHRAVTARTPQGVKVIPPFACVVVISSTHVRPGARPTLFPAASVKVVVALSLARCQVTGR